MAASKWSETVEIAVRRLVARLGRAEFTRQQLIAHELGRIVHETGSRGATPHMTLSRELQQLRDRGQIAFVGAGTYQLLEAPVTLPAVAHGHCVFVVHSDSIHDDKPDRYFRFPPTILPAAARSVGEWVVYQEPRATGGRGYHAVARVEQIIRDPADESMFLALIEPGSYLEFGQDVSSPNEGADRAYRLSDGAAGPNDLGEERIRPIPGEEFHRIVSLGLIAEGTILPREDQAEPSMERLRDPHGQEPLPGPTERLTVLVERKVRDRQFRKRVLDAYQARCALTGMRLINGGGRAETQAAHIMSVEAGGPDTVTNGIALSGTAHWMFDRGLVSLSDAGEILLSPRIGDVEGVQKLLYPDRTARLPLDRNRPSSRYLAWHREYHGY